MEQNDTFLTDGDTWSDMCVRVPIVRPPKLSDVLFADDEDEEGGQTEGQTEGPTDEQTEGQTEGPKRKRKRRDSGLLKINADDEIAELDQPLFPESERIFSQVNPEISNSKFFQVQVLAYIYETSNDSQDKLGH